MIQVMNETVRGERQENCRIVYFKFVLLAAMCGVSSVVGHSCLELQVPSLSLLS